MVPMIKLYKRVRGRLRYHEAWLHEGIIREHWGQVGKRGSLREHAAPKRKSADRALREVLKAAMDDGYEELMEAERKSLVLEWAFEGHATDEHRQLGPELMFQIKGILGWTGVGSCDDGGMDCEGMRFVCRVMDVKLAIRLLEEAWKDTQHEGRFVMYEP